MKPELERRGFAGEIRVEGAGQGARLRGYAAVFNEETELWPGYFEKIRPGAFAKTLADTRRAKHALWNHETSAPLASTSGRPPLRLWEDERGLGFEFQVPPTQAGRELVELVRSGIIDGASFGFRTIKADEKARSTGAGVAVVREITEAELFEVSPVTHPAYEQTSVALRARDQLSAHRALGDDAMRTAIQIRAEIDEIRTGARGRDLSAYEARRLRSLEEEITKASTRTTPPPQEQPDTTAGVAPAAHTRESRPYSLVNFFRASSSGDWRDAKVELRAADALRERLGDPHDERARHVPYSALLPLKRQTEIEKRDVDSSGAPSLIATDLIPEEFIELLRNEAKVVMAGARVLPNLVGNVDIGRQNAAAVGGWLATETATIVEGQLTTDKISLTPKTFALRTEITRKMLKQSSPGVEELVREDLRRVIAIGVDAAALNGTGASGQPTGLLAASGVGTVTHSAGVVTWGNLQEYEADLGTANAGSGRLAYLMRSSIRQILKTTPKITGAAEGFLMEPNGTVNGYPAHVSEQVPASTLVFGDWSQLLIGMWGALDLFSDPYTLGNTGGLVVRGFQDCDIGIRHPASFSKSASL